MWINLETKVKLDLFCRVSELSTTTSSLQTQKRKLEQEIQAMHSDLEDQVNELKGSEEHAKKAMADAARLAEELRQEQVKTKTRFYNNVDVSQCFLTQLWFVWVWQKINLEYTAV